MGMLQTNLVHRLDAKPAVLETAFWQWEAARRRGLASTSLVTYEVLHDPRPCEEIRNRAEGSGDELGLHFHALGGPHFRRTYGTPETAFWLLPRDQRVALIDEMVTLFRQRFGRDPVSVGSYILDAWTLRYFAAKHPSVRTAITNCFEEGVNMFRGNNHNWHLFSDGGPWGPFFPSRANALVPARDAAEAIDIVALPHLNRDMILSLTSRNDLFSSHPLNLFRAKINDGPQAPYLFRFLEQWARQVELNGWSYLNIFVSSPWLTPGHWALGRPEDGRALYEQMLDYLAAEQEEGRGQVLTMAGFAADFRQRVAPGAATICHWQEVLRPNPKRQMVWLVNSHYRLALDLNLGGAIVDLRAYDGRRDGDLGPETTSLWNGNYPYLISAQHRGGFWNSGQFAELSCGPHRASLAERRVRATVTRRGEGGWEVETEPMALELGPVRVTLVSRWRGDASGCFEIERCLQEVSDPAAEIAVTERLGASYGTTEYPEDLRGVELWLESAAGPAVRQAFDYLGREEESARAHAVGADIGPAGVRLSLQPGAGAATAACAGGFSVGVLFSPFYRLWLTQPLTLTSPARSCLTVTPLPC